ncbi:MAG: SPOR domain-containing protein [Bacterioplanes sp.]|nr:SPOR domain-containing protein [Bacterioplanes sp.]
MRWIFFSLVFGNLLLLAMFWQQPAAPAPAAAIQIPNHSQRLQLTSEMTALTPRVTRESGSAPSVATCYAAGPFVDEIDARHLQARSAALNFTATIFSLEKSSDRPSEHWVHIPPRSSRDAAMRLLRELQGRNIDSYIITQGELADGISLGLFRVEASAKKVQSDLQALGYAAEIRVVNDTQKEYWVEITESAQLNERLRERIRASDQQIRWELIECRRER